MKKFSKVLALVLTFAMVLGLVSTNSAEAASTMTLNKTSKVLYTSNDAEKNSFNLSVRNLPAEATVEYKAVNDMSCITVNATTGLVTAKAPGTAAVFCVVTVGNVKTNVGTCTFIVKKGDSGNGFGEISGNSEAFEGDEPFALSVANNEKDTRMYVYWESSDESVFTIDQAGKVTPVNGGEGGSFRTADAIAYFCSVKGNKDSAVSSISKQIKIKSTKPYFVQENPYEGNIIFPQGGLNPDKVKENLTFGYRVIAKAKDNDGNAKEAVIKLATGATIVNDKTVHINTNAAEIQAIHRNILDGTTTFVFDWGETDQYHFEVAGKIGKINKVEATAYSEGNAVTEITAEIGVTANVYIRIFDENDVDITALFCDRTMSKYAVNEKLKIGEGAHGNSEHLYSFVMLNEEQILTAGYNAEKGLFVGTITCGSEEDETTDFSIVVSTGDVTTENLITKNSDPIAVKFAKFIPTPTPAATDTPTPTPESKFNKESVRIHFEQTRLTPYPIDPSTGEPALPTVDIFNGDFREGDTENFEIRIVATMNKEPFDTESGQFVTVPGVEPVEYSSNKVGELMAGKHYVGQTPVPNYDPELGYIEFSTSDPNILFVSHDGVLQFNKVGEPCVIIVTYHSKDDPSPLGTTLDVVLVEAKPARKLSEVVSEPQVFTYTTYLTPEPVVTCAFAQILDQTGVIYTDTDKVTAEIKLDNADNEPLCKPVLGTNYSIDYDPILLKYVLHFTNIGAANVPEDVYYKEYSFTVTFKEEGTNAISAQPVKIRIFDDAKLFTNAPAYSDGSKAYVRTELVEGEGIAKNIDTITADYEIGKISTITLSAKDTAHIIYGDNGIDKVQNWNEAIMLAGDVKSTPGTTLELGKYYYRVTKDGSADYTKGVSLIENPTGGNTLKIQINGAKTSTSHAKNVAGLNIGSAAVNKDVYVLEKDDMGAGLGVYKVEIFRFMNDTATVEKLGTDDYMPIFSVDYTINANNYSGIEYLGVRSNDGNAQTYDDLFDAFVFKRNGKEFKKEDIEEGDAIEVKANVAKDGDKIFVKEITFYKKGDSFETDYVYVKDVVTVNQYINCKAKNAQR